MQRVRQGRRRRSSARCPTVIASEAKQSSSAPAGAQINAEIAAAAALFSWHASRALDCFVASLLAMTQRRFASERCSVFNCQTAREFFVARMERSEIRGLSPWQESRIALRFIRATNRRASSPRFFVRPGEAGLHARWAFTPFAPNQSLPSPPRGRAERMALNCACSSMCRQPEQHTAGSYHGSSHTPALRTRWFFRLATPSSPQRSGL
jgi:hypothetical protein